jgi:hypothetical protein
VDGVSLCIYIAFGKYSDPLTFSHILLRYSLILKLINLFFFRHQSTHNTPQWQSGNRFLETVANLWRRKKQIYLIYIIIQTLWYATRNWAQVHPVSIDHLWDVSTTWLESTCSKLNWLDMIWKGTHLSISGHTVDSPCESKTQAMRSKELSVELRDRIVSRHRSEER